MFGMKGASSSTKEDFERGLSFLPLVRGTHMSYSTPPLSLLSPKSTGKEATAAAPMSPRGERRRDSLRTRIISRGEHHGEEGGQRREEAGGIDREGKEGATGGERAVGEGGARHRRQMVVSAGMSGPAGREGRAGAGGTGREGATGGDPGSRGGHRGRRRNGPPAAAGGTYGDGSLHGRAAAVAKRRSGRAEVRPCEGERKERTIFLCNGWQWWVISIQLHVYVHNRSFWSCKRGAPKLQQKMNYNSRVLELHRVLELACLARKLFGAAGVQLQSHAKQALSLAFL